MNWNWLDAEFIADAVQIAILYLAFYSLLKAARGSRFGQVLTGAGILFGISIAFTYIFHFTVLSRILQGMLLYLALSSVVIFQPEIRRFLATVGSLIFSESNRHFDSGRVTPETVADAIFALALHKTGALIAFERGISLRGYEANGVKLDALISRELLISVFTEPLPLHDGGITVRKGRIAAAHCLFPVSTKEELSVSGMRHRAAVGLSEETDALVVVVSEETGRISIAHNGRILRYPANNDETRASLLRWIRKTVPQKIQPGERVVRWVRDRMAKGRKTQEDKTA